MDKVSKMRILLLNRRFRVSPTSLRLGSSWWTPSLMFAGSLGNNGCHNSSTPIPQTALFLGSSAYLSQSCANENIQGSNHQYKNCTYFMLAYCIPREKARMFFPGPGGFREGAKKSIFFRKKVLNYGWVGVKSPKLLKM